MVGTAAVRSLVAHGHDVRFAWGYGGQFIFVVPTLELVVVMTSDAESRREGDHNRALHRLLEAPLPPLEILCSKM